VRKASKNYTYIFSKKAQDDYQYWERNNPKQLMRIAKLIEGIISTPFQGIGKPKALGYDYQGAWSRRIDSVHRIVYAVDEDVIYIISMRGHYAEK
jgi:toxin YoeB